MTVSSARSRSRPKSPNAANRTASSVCSTARISTQKATAPTSTSASKRDINQKEDMDACCDMRMDRIIAFVREWDRNTYLIIVGRRQAAPPQRPTSRLAYTIGADSAQSLKLCVTLRQPRHRTAASRWLTKRGTQQPHKRDRGDRSGYPRWPTSKRPFTLQSRFAA
jgi:hypothetical protein